MKESPTCGVAIDVPLIRTQRSLLGDWKTYVGKEHSANEIALGAPQYQLVGVG